MKKLLRLEEAAQFIAVIVFLILIEADWWWYLVLFAGPDIGMFGYVINPKIGAIAYNLLHHKAVGILFFLMGVYTQHDPLLLLGSILFGHAAMDRMFGYGLKYFDHFKHTHLGQIGEIHNG